MAQNASDDVAAAIAAAVERFQVETAPAERAVGEAVSPWRRAALVEGVAAKGAVQKHLEGGFEWLS